MPHDAQEGPLSVLGARKDSARRDSVGRRSAGHSRAKIRIALENAVLVASVPLLTEVTMTDIPEREKEAHEPALAM